MAELAGLALQERSWQVWVLRGCKEGGRGGMLHRGDSCIKVVLCVVLGWDSLCGNTPSFTLRKY